MWKRRPSAAEQARAQRFEQLVLPHLDAAYNLARWLTRDPDQAQDVVQEAYRRAYQFFDRFQGDNARPWLLKIVRNTYYTALKQEHVDQCHVSFEEDLPELEDTEWARGEEPAAGDPERTLLQQEARQLITQALEQLPVEFREIVILRELEELSYKAIARIVDIPVGTVMSRLARGRKLLAETLQSRREVAP
jgi:RNA polymerase sigma factor (sigma-70 family)